MTAIAGDAAGARVEPERLVQGVVLLATDGSPDAAVARRAAVQLAGRGGFALHVVHAWQVSAVVGGFPGYAAPPEFFEGCEESAADLLDAETRAVQAEGVPVAGSHLVEGRPARAIATVATRIDATVVVLGSRGLGGLGRLVVGSVAEETLHTVHRPVLIVRGDAGAWPPAQIVAGDDGSPDALAAITLAARVAHVLDVPITLLRVLPQLEEGGPSPRGELAAVRAGAQTELDEHAEAVRELTGARVGTRLAGGSPAQALLDAADAAGGALIVTGCRGAGLMTRMRLGSVSNRLLHGSHVSMLVVPAQAAAAAVHGGGS